MIVEIWTWLATISIILFVGGILYASFVNKLVILGLSIPFMIATSLYAFDIEKVCAGSEAIITTTKVYNPIAGFFGFLTLLGIGLLIYYSLSSVGEAIQGRTPIA